MSETISMNEIRRYQRHLTLPEVGMEGQERLKAARVLILGAGGLGSPVAMYLAAAGVGTLGLVDFDAVDESNLQRQILHGQSDVGRAKIESAMDTLREINPFVTLIPYQERFCAENAESILTNFDVVVGGTDNFSATYLANDACVMFDKPFVYGSIFQFQGQASLFCTAGGPCYRCLFPVPPPPGSVPDCAAGGVFGVLPGVIGSIQATEVIKVILGIGMSLTGRFLTYDALEMSFNEITLKRDPACPVCGDAPSITTLKDLEISCSLPEADAVDEITANELRTLLDSGTAPMLLDVREDWEVAMGIISDAKHIPLVQIDARSNELDPDEPMIVYCKGGVRSRLAIDVLTSKGFGKLTNLADGYMAWPDK